MDVLLTVALYLLLAIIIGAIIVAVLNALKIGEPWRTIAIALVALAAVVVVARTLGLM